MTLWVSTSTAVFARDAALLRQQHALGKRQHLHREAQVGRDLHRERQAVVADVRHFRADVVEQRLDALERLARPPTIIESLPCSSVMTLPDTGASTMSAPCSRTFAASARLTAGLTVLMSMSSLPGTEAGDAIRPDRWPPPRARPNRSP